MPLAVASYLFLPIHHCLAFWFCGWICAFAEITDYLDGKIARARGEVSDFGKLADPFCDVIYRMAMFLVFLLPVAGVGYPIMYGEWHGMSVDGTVGFTANYAAFVDVGQPIYLLSTEARGLVLAARTSGKIKAWFQGVTIITVMAFPAFWFRLEPWHLTYAFWATWACAILSVASIIEYIWVNRKILGQLATKAP